MGSPAIAPGADAASLAEWWVPLLGPDGLRPPPESEVPGDVRRNGAGFASRHADRRKDAQAALAKVGPMRRGDFAILGIEVPGDLAAADGSALYVQLQRLTGLSIEPCRHDVMFAAVAEARGGSPEKRWAFTSTRKAMPDLRLPRALGRGGSA